MYDSDLRCLRKVKCKYLWRICCNSKFVFGLFESYDSNDSDEDDNDEQEEEHLTEKIQVHHLGTLSEAFELRLPHRKIREVDVCLQQVH